MNPMIHAAQYIIPVASFALAPISAEMTVRASHTQKYIVCHENLKTMYKL